MEEQEEKKPSGGEPAATESRNNNDDGDEVAYFDSFPPGFRFKPYDEELVVFYLKRKIMDEPLPRNRIKEVELYKFNPQTLSENWKSYGENVWYFFTPRDRKYKNGERPNRAAGDGYWKATGADKPVKYNGAEVGSRKALVFYKGKPPRGDKTDWIMHEFRFDNTPKRKREDNDMRLDDWVLCRLYKKVDKSARGSAPSRDDSFPEEEQEDETQPQYDQDCGNMTVEDSKMLVRQGNFIHDCLDSFDIYGDYYNQSNQMGLNGFDNNALYVQGSQGSFPRGPQSYYPQLVQTPEVIQHMFPGYQNPNLMVPVPLRPGEVHVKQEHFTEYQSDELLNVPPVGNGFDQFVSEFCGNSNPVVPQFFTDDKKPMENGLDQTVSDFKEPSNSVLPPLNDNKKQQNS